MYITWQNQMGWHGCLRRKKIYIEEWDSEQKNEKTIVA